MLVTCAGVARAFAARRVDVYAADDFAGAGAEHGVGESAALGEVLRVAFEVAQIFRQAHLVWPACPGEARRRLDMADAGRPCGIVRGVVPRPERFQPEFLSREPARYREIHRNEELIAHQAMVAVRSSHSPCPAAAKPLPWWPAHGTAPPATSWTEPPVSWSARFLGWDVTPTSRTDRANKIPCMPRYPDIESYETGLLDTGDGNLVYWETCGNPDGVPALIVHGGPGSGCTAGNRRSFDPEKYWIIIFDQRNCGRSLPHASDPAADMSLNTTEHLLRDMEQLREHLGVEKWLLRGGSWGDAVAGVRAAASGAGQRDAHAQLQASSQMMEDPGIGVRSRAATEWTAWEDAVISQESNGSPGAYGDRPDDAKLAFVRICSHYLAHDGFLEDGVLIREAGKLAGIPGVLIHGRNDLSGGACTPWQLARAWPGAELIIIEDSGHTGSTTMTDQMHAAAGRLYEQITNPA